VLERVQMDKAGLGMCLEHSLHIWCDLLR